MLGYTANVCMCIGLRLSCVCVVICMCINMCIYVKIYIQIYVHIHVCVCVCWHLRNLPNLLNPNNSYKRKSTVPGAFKSLARCMEHPWIPKMLQSTTKWTNVIESALPCWKSSPYSAKVPTTLYSIVLYRILSCGIFSIV